MLDLLGAASIISAVGGGAIIAFVVLVRPGRQSARSRRYARWFWLAWAGALPLGIEDLLSDVDRRPGLPAGLLVLKDVLTIAQFACGCALWRALHEHEPPRRRRRRLRGRRPALARVPTR